MDNIPSSSQHYLCHWVTRIARFDYVSLCAQRPSWNSDPAPSYLLYHVRCSVQPTAYHLGFTMEPIPRWVFDTLIGYPAWSDRLIGKRYNVLRKRKDSWDYDVDQLVLGTILFTLVAFLSPTIITYYALFALVSPSVFPGTARNKIVSLTQARLIIVLFHAGLDTILVLMNHFPLFALLLRIKSPLRMPGK